MNISVNDNSCSWKDQFKYDTVFKPIWKKHTALGKVYLKWREKFYNTTDTNKKSSVNKSYKYASAKLEEFEDVFESVINHPAYNQWVIKQEQLNWKKKVNEGVK